MFLVACALSPDIQVKGDSMKSIITVTLMLCLGAVVYADGGEGSEERVRVSRFESDVDNVAADAPEYAKELLPKDAKGKTLNYMDLTTYKMAEFSYLIPVKEPKKPASDFTKISGALFSVDASMGEMMLKMTLDGTSASKRKEMLKEMKDNFKSTKEEAWSRRRIFFEPEAVTAKSLPGANVWVQKWETDDSSPKQIWYDYYYIGRSGSNVLEVKVYAVTSVEAGEKIVQELLTRTNKKK